MSATKPTAVSLSTPRKQRTRATVGAHGPLLGERSVEAIAAREQRRVIKEVLADDDLDDRRIVKAQPAPMHGQRQLRAGCWKPAADAERDVYPPACRASEPDDVVVREGRDHPVEPVFRALLRSLVASSVLADPDDLHPAAVIREEQRAAIAAALLPV